VLGSRRDAWVCQQDQRVRQHSHGFVNHVPGGSSISSTRTKGSSTRARGFVNHVTIVREFSGGCVAGGGCCGAVSVSWCVISVVSWVARLTHVTHQLVNFTIIDVYMQL
jgi:hypothetical protein